MSIEPLADLERNDAPDPKSANEFSSKHLTDASESFALPSADTKPPMANGLMNLLLYGSSFVLLVLALLLGGSFWAEWLQSTDRVLCSIFAISGFFVALLRCKWEQDENNGSIPTSVLLPTVILLGASIVVFAIALTTGRVKLLGIAVGLLVASLVCYRVRGESVMNAISLGMVFMIPAFVDACKDRNLFRASENVALKIASGLSDAVGHSHIVENDGIRFGHGVFNQFACEGHWDSIITYIGISCFLIFAFRRNLIAGIITLSMAFVVWMAVRGTACVAIAQYASSYGTWPEWTFTLELALFVIGALILLSLDSFFGGLLKPIPVEHVNPDFPLFALSWNFLAELPSLTVEVPERLQDHPTPEEFE